MVSQGLQELLDQLIMTTKSDQQLLLEELTELKKEHNDLNIKIDYLTQQVTTNELEIGRLKKHKLKLKDAITRLQSNLIPDLHA